MGGHAGWALGAAGNPDRLTMFWKASRSVLANPTSVGNAYLDELEKTRNQMAEAGARINEKLTPEISRQAELSKVLTDLESRRFTLAARAPENAGKDVAYLKKRLALAQAEEQVRRRALEAEQSAGNMRGQVYDAALAAWRKAYLDVADAARDTKAAIVDAAKAESEAAQRAGEKTRSKIAAQTGLQQSLLEQVRAQAAAGGDLATVKEIDDDLRRLEAVAWWQRMLEQARAAGAGPQTLSAIGRIMETMMEPSPALQSVEARGTFNAMSARNLGAGNAFADVASNTGKTVTELQGLRRDILNNAPAAI